MNPTAVSACMCAVLAKACQVCVACTSTLWHLVVFSPEAPLPSCYVGKVSALPPPTPVGCTAAFLVSGHTLGSSSSWLLAGGNTFCFCQVIPSIYMLGGEVCFCQVITHVAVEYGRVVLCCSRQGFGGPRFTMRAGCDRCLCTACYFRKVPTDMDATKVFSEGSSFRKSRMCVGGRA